MAMAVILILLIVGTLLFHFLSPWYFTPLASNWSMIDTTVDITFWVTGIVFIAVNAFLVYCVLKYRHRKGNEAHYEPESTKLESTLTVITSLGVAAMLAPGLMVWAEFVTPPDEATEVEVVGRQWHWLYRFPGEDGLLGTVDIAYTSPENPFGINPEDQNGQDDVLIAHPELHLPIDQPVKLLLRSTDVLHNFTVPQFRVKMDLVPGMVTSQWLTPTVVGSYEVFCEELCGIAHYAMRGRVVVDTAADFETWLARQPTFAETQARPAGDPTQGAAMYAVCAACHGPQGEGNPALNSPKLAGQQGWYLRRQIEHFRAGVRGTDPADVFGLQMAPMAQTLATPAAIDNVVAYIETLPDAATAPTISGDAERGRDLFTTCAACHGADGRGVWAMNAPRIQGLNDWYLSTQLHNFIGGVRGTHPQDLYGEQMARMATFLSNDQAIDDLIAYINTL
jgi:cytochrome c oxidase subunit 2